jgi:beta-lactamase superfamily II metal-dependent hydrolase
MRYSSASLISLLSTGLVEKFGGRKMQSSQDWSKADIATGKVGIMGIKVWVTIYFSNLFYHPNGLNKTIVMKKIRFYCIHVALYFFLSQASAQTLEIHQINVGQGDATLVLIRDSAKMRKALEDDPHTKKIIPADKLKWLKLAMDSNVNLNETVKKVVLIDAGAGPNQADKINQYMIREGIDPERFDYFLLSHYHDDHYGGFKKLKETHGWIPDTAIDRGNDTEASAKCKGDYIDLVPATRRKIASVKNTEIVLKADGPSVVMTCVTGNRYVLGQDPAKRARSADGGENDDSVGWLIQYGAFRFYTGGDLNGNKSGTTRLDLETPLADSIAAKDNSVFTTFENKAIPKGHICSIKVNHHGGKESTNSYFLSKIRPTTAVVSCGFDMQYRHPKVEVIRRIDAQAGEKWDPGMLGLGSTPNTIEHSYYTSMMEGKNYFYQTKGVTQEDKNVYNNVGNDLVSDGIIAGNVVVIVDDANISTESVYLVYWDGEQSDKVAFPMNRTKNKDATMRKPNPAGTHTIRCHKATTVQYITNK